MTAEPRPGSGSGLTTGTARFRHDIEGLRAVAVLLVLGYHAGLPLPRAGFLGVDVFFVISGYLITDLLVREVASTGRLSWPRFLARRVRRLLPAAALVLLVTGLASAWLLHGALQRLTGGDITAAALYAVNWRLADRAVDYLAQASLVSPVQHYWSLAVEEQFYLLWPLLILLLLVLARRLGRPVPGRGGIGMLLAAICLPSFAWSVWLTATDPARAYFVTTTRVWELGVGAGLALWLGARARDAHPAWLTRRAGPLAVVGLATIVAVAVLLPDGARWPGALALLPTLGTAAVIAAGATGAPTVVGRLLGTAPMTWVGGLSYSLYLWHFPVVVLATRSLDDPPSWLPAVAVVASVLPAWLGHRLVERPLHRSRALVARPGPTLALGAALSLGAAAAGIPAITADSPFVTRPATGTLPPLSTLGAATLTSPPQDDTRRYAVDAWSWMTPDPERSGEDRPAADVDRCQVPREAASPVVCTFGATDGPVDVVLVGDSKALQWLPGLEAEAADAGWRITVFGKSSCTFSAAPAHLSGTAYPQCDDWNASVMAAIAADPPDLLVTSGQASSAWTGTAISRSALVSGLQTRWREVTDLGVGLLVLGDNPNSPDDLQGCMGRHPHQLTRCAFDRAAAVRGSSWPVQREAWDGAPDQPGGLLDVTPWVCPEAACPTVVGHVTVQRPGDHITATYAATMAAVLRSAADAVLAREAAHLGPGPRLR